MQNIRKVSDSFVIYFPAANEVTDVKG